MPWYAWVFVFWALVVGYFCGVRVERWKWEDELEARARDERKWKRFRGRASA